MIYTLGESLMDLIFESDSKIIAKSGGSMLNLSVSLGRCGLKVSLVSELGDDIVGDKIVSFLKENNVDEKYVNRYLHHKSPLALAVLDENSIPTYSFYKPYPEERTLKAPPSFNSDDILVFGSFYSLEESIHNYIKGLTEMANSSKAIVIYDPNIRMAHKIDSEQTKKYLIENLAAADIIKGSNEDFCNIFGNGDDNYFVSELRKINPEAIIFITRGSEGARVFSKDQNCYISADSVKLKSTIGAGDNFTAGIVYSIKKQNIAKNDLAHLDSNALMKMLEYGKGFSSNVCTSYENYISKEFANSLIQN